MAARTFQLQVAEIAANIIEISLSTHIGRIASFYIS